MWSATARGAASRPRARPCRRSSSNLSRCRSEMRRYSNLAAIASAAATSSPAGVVVSRPTSSATRRQPSRCAHSTRPRTSALERPSRSIFATTIPPARPACTSASAAASAARRGYTSDAPAPRTPNGRRHRAPGPTAPPERSRRHNEHHRPASIHDTPPARPQLLMAPPVAPQRRDTARHPLTSDESA